MKIEFDKSTILNRFAESYKSSLDDGLDTTLRYIDEITPIRTGDLISHNKVKKGQINGLFVTGGVYNDLGDYEHKVEEGMGRPMTYHRHGVPFKRGEGAHMFELGFGDAIGVLLALLRGNAN